VTTGPLDVPVPGVVVLVGAAGAGKTTLAAATFAPDEIVSSDELRAAVRGDPADQSATRVAFGILHRELVRRLAAGRLVVVDATNLTATGRSAILRRAAIAGAAVVALVLLPSADAVHARNARRPGRSVPADVVDRQLAAAAALGGDVGAVARRLHGEGFAAVHVWMGPEAERFEIGVRRVPRTPQPAREPANPVRPPG
jgi:predicted kinase